MNMKLAFLILLFSASASQAQELVGTWAGGLRAGGQYYPMSLRVTEGVDGPRGLLDVPGRSIIGRELMELEFDGESLRFEADHEGNRALFFDGQLSVDLAAGEFTMEFGERRIPGKFQIMRVQPKTLEELRAYAGDFQVEGLGRLRFSSRRGPVVNSLVGYSYSLGNEIVLYHRKSGEFASGFDATDAPPVEIRMFFSGDDLEIARSGRDRVSGRRIEEGFAVDEARIDAKVEAMRRAGTVPSYSIGIVRGDDLVYARAYGLADIESKTEATTQTLYQIGSLSKTFAATLMGMLRDEGKLQFDDPVWQHLPEDLAIPHIRAADGERITMRQIATHTSGLPREFANKVDTEALTPAPYFVEDLYAGLELTYLIAPVGERWSYSNLGFGLLGHTLGRIGGMPFEDLLTDKLLEPLGMTDSFVTLTDDRRARLATHYWAEEQPRRAHPAWVFGDISANGGVVSNVPDLAKYMSLQLRAGEEGVTPISGLTLAELHEPQRRRGSTRNQSIGIGWWVDQSAQRGAIVSHGGENDGHSSHFAFSPRHGVGIICLANLGGSAAYDLGDWLMGEVLRQVRAQTLPNLDLAQTAYSDGDWTDAAWAYGKLAEECARSGMFAYRHALSRYRLGDLSSSRAGFEKALAANYAEGNCQFRLACLDVIVGERDAAIERLGKALAAGIPVEVIAEDAALRALHADVRFQEMLKKHR